MVKNFKENFIAKIKQSINTYVNLIDSDQVSLLRDRMIPPFKYQDR